MKIHNLILFQILLFVFICTSCIKSVDSVDSDRKIKDPYFGQSPPGTIPQLFAPGLVSTGAHEMSISISNSLNEIYIGRSSLNWTSTIVLFFNGNDGWRDPVIAPFAESLDNNYPFLSPDNKSIYFNSDRLATDESSESARRIWVSGLLNEKWDMPDLVNIQIDPSVSLTFPSVSSVGNIYFNATLENGIGESDLYFVKKEEDGYGKPECLGSNINSSYHEFHPYISPDEEILMFDAVRPDGFGSNDIYISFKTESGKWTKAENMGELINGPSADMRPYLSPDGKYLFFSSNRSVEVKLDSNEFSFEDFSKIVNGPGNGSQDIYWVSADIITQLKRKVLGI